MNEFKFIEQFERKTITSIRPSSDVLIDRERDSIALSIPSSRSFSVSNCRCLGWIDSCWGRWWTCEVMRRWLVARTRFNDGRRGIVGRNCGGGGCGGRWFSKHAIAMRNDERA